MSRNGAPWEALGRLAFLISIGGVARQEMHLLCKQTYAGALPAASTIF